MSNFGNGSALDKEMERLSVERLRQAKGKAASNSAQAVLEGARRQEITNTLKLLEPAFAHLDISVRTKGKQNPTWTLQSGSRVVRVGSDGVVEIIE